MKVTVTGGAGFIGSHVVDLLLANGHQVRVVDNLSTGCVDNLKDVYGRIAFVNSDISTERGATKACCDADAVIHLAAIPSVARSMVELGGLRKDNLLGTLRILAAAEKYGVRRVIYASTCAVYAEKDGPLAETDPVAPASPYAEAKFAGEQAVREFGSRNSRQDSIALRLFNVVGPRQRASGGYAAVVPAFIDNTLDGDPCIVYGDGNQTRDFVNVMDVAMAFVLAVAEKKLFAGAVINVGSGISISINNVLNLISGFSGNHFPCSFKSAPARPGEIRHVCADVNKLRTELGLSCSPDLRNSVEAYYEWKKGETK